MCTMNSWCDQEGREHYRHEVTAITLFGENWPELESATVQLVVHGFDDDDAVPMLAIVDSEGNQRNIVLSWDDAHSLAMKIVEMHRTFARLRVPQ